VIKKVLFIVFLYSIFFVPLGVLVLYAFSSSWKFPDIIPKMFDLRSFRFFSDNITGITGSIMSSMLYSVCTVLFTFILTVMPASVFAREEFRLKGFVEGLLLAPALIPAMAFSMGLQFVFIKIGISDTLIGIVLVLTVISYPYMLRALTAGFKTFSVDHYLCARNLGAGMLAAFFKVELPLLMPSFVAGASVVFLVSFSEYFLVFLIGGGSVPSFSGYLFPLLNSSDRSVASFLTLVFLIIPIILFIIIDRSVTVLYRKRGME
jgi:putative spermidine/putrescine transport system permease protein